MKRYKIIAWIMLVLSVIHIITVVAGIEILNDKLFNLKVAPNPESTLSKEPIKKFEGSVLYFKGDLIINDLPWWKRALLSNDTTDALAMSLLAFLVLLIIQTLQRSNTYHKKIGNYISLGGAIFLFSTICDILQRYYLKDEVLTRTNGEFILLRNEAAILPDTIVGVILLVFSAVYTEAYKLKTEQDLTI
ncbi:MAG: hypothetical protein U1C70_07525 [Sediminibacterium sp.]|uniref:hypothetical protein n=1 Tax=Sediminibacterium sp. TaxID=1917865 RepID=UPI002ABCB130|nr:hypothetical protein [Sediminibacterium sp.]MDZ4071658.1 hypothetical protein [Sediminibacterium sp.]